MTSPIQPEVCEATGRLLTEWFEFPEYTDEQLIALACEAHGLTPEERPKLDLSNPDNPLNDLARKIDVFITRRKRTKWRNGMTQQEVQARMNEATKMVDPENFKFLPDSVRERTGLEVNPLWMMECLIRSGVLSPKEQINALTQLAAYTHSKAPTFSHSTKTELTAEDWLVTLAKEEYKTIDEAKPDFQPRQPAEAGTHSGYQSKIKRLTNNTNSVKDFQEAQFEMILSELDEEE